MDDVMGYVTAFFIGGIISMICVVKSINNIVDADCGKYGQYVTDNYKLTCARK